MSTRDDQFFEGTLLAEFDRAPAGAWHADLANDLGDDWRERLRWNVGDRVTPNDRVAGTNKLDVLPFYRAEDLSDEVPTGCPGARPGWAIRHDLAATDPTDLLREALHALDGGAEALGLPARLTASGDALDALSAEVDLSKTALHVEDDPDAARRLLSEAAGGSLTFDPAARLFSASDANADAADEYEALASLVREREQPAPSVRLVTADARPAHDAGAGPVASLALALASMSEHFARLTERGVAAETVAAHAQVVLPVGTRFFVEVARLRATRRLFAQLADAYGASEAPRLQVQAQTAWRAMTLYDPHLNLLRGATAGAAAAILGGADVLAVRPFDAAQKQRSEFTPPPDQTGGSALGVRLSLNAQHILREEAHLGDVADPAAGSYYAEVLTDRIARRAWERFQEIEGEGGLLAVIGNGALHERLSRVHDDRRDALSHRRRVRVGTNHFPNLDEERLEHHLAFSPEREDDAPRETEAFERLRLTTELDARRQGARRPAAFLFPVGTPKVRSARANFARNVLGCAGFRTLEHAGFDTHAEGVPSATRAVDNGEAHFVVCCAPDEDYAALLPALHDALAAHDAPLLVVARPDALTDHQRDLADVLLHRGMNVLDTLEALQRRLGISTRPSILDTSHAS